MEYNSLCLSDEDFDRFVTCVGSEELWQKHGILDGKLRPWQFQLFFKLLYGSALSIRQALNLELRDLDLSFRLATIRNHDAQTGKTVVKKTTILPAHVNYLKPFTTIKKLTDRVFETTTPQVCNVASLAIGDLNLPFVSGPNYQPNHENFWDLLFQNSCIHRMRQAGAGEELIRRKLSHIHESSQIESDTVLLKRLLDWEAGNN